MIINTFIIVVVVVVVVVILSLIKLLVYSFKVDGLSLLCATLRHWLTLDNACPKILVSTHFHGLIQQNLLPNVPAVKYQVIFHKF